MFIFHPSIVRHCIAISLLGIAMSFHLILISPHRLFQTTEYLWSSIPEEIDRNIEFTLFKCPIVGAIMDHNHQLSLPATLYLATHAANGRSTQGSTVSTYGEGLVMWLNYLSSRQIAIEQATEHDVQLFRNLLCHSPQKNGEPYADNTINLRVKTVLRFHQWALQGRIFFSPLGEWANAMSERQQTNWVRRHRLTPVIYKRIPRALTAGELENLFQIVGKPYSLIFRWAVVTGLRRFELCSLQKDVLPPFNEKTLVNENSMVEFDLIRKGHRKWTVYVPKVLVSETYWYQIAERSKPRLGFEGYVFLTNKGYPVSKGELSRRFHAAMIELKINATLHCLRHTYAVITMRILQRHADLGESINPLKTLQILMGHSSIESTEIYLQTLDVHSDAVEEALNFLYGATQ